MNEYLLQAVDTAAYYPPDDETPAEFATVIDLGGNVLNIINDSNPTKPGDSLIGGWDKDGVQVEALDLALYKQIRPLGNTPPRPIYDESGAQIGTTQGGDATSALVTHGFAGWGVRSTTPLYGGQSVRMLGAAQVWPETNEPFGIEVRPKYFGDNSNPAWDGWGWRAEFVGPASQRDPSNYAIGVYNDAECTDYWYTTGAFSESLSEWQTDDDGTPLTVWSTEYNDAFLTGIGNAAPVTVHHAVLLGAAQEGYSTLPGGDETATSGHLFWESTQGEGGGTWTDTGVTVTSYIGAGTYGVSDSTLFAADDLLRIGGSETTFVREHSAGIIVVDPDVGNQNGASIERLQ